MRKFVFYCLLAMSVNTCFIEESAFAAAHYFSTIRNSSGDAVSGATVSVYNAGTITPVSIFSDSAGTIPKSNPFLSDSLGNYDFYVPFGIYKVVVSKIGVGVFTVDNIIIGIVDHADTHKLGGGDEILLSEFGGSISSAQITNNVIVNEDVSVSAGIVESKLSLNFPTHSNTNDPTTDQKAALGGTSGLPSGTNKYVTNNDARNTNSRTPTVHAASHTDGGSDEITVTTGQLSGVNAGTNLTADLEEETHVTEHQDGGADELSVAGLSGALADAQKSEVLLNGASVGTRPKINLIEGTDIDLTAADNAGQNRVDVTVNSTASVAGAGTLDVYEGIVLKKSDVTDMYFFNMTVEGTGPAGHVIISPTPPSYYPVTFLGDSPVNPAYFNVFTSESGYGIGFDQTGPSPLEGEWSPKLTIFPCYQLAGNGPPTLGGIGIEGGDAVLLPPYAGGTFPCDNTSVLDAPFDGQTLVFDGADRTSGAWHNRYSPTICINDEYCEAGKWISLSDSFTIEDSVSYSGDPVRIGLDTEALSHAQYLRDNIITTDTPTDGQTLIYDFDTSTWLYGTGTSDLIVVSEHLPFPDTFTGINKLTFVSPLEVTDDGAGAVEIRMGEINTYEPDSINDTHIFWGTPATATAVNADDIPNGNTNSFVPTAQLVELTSSGNTGLHYHASDRDLGNATGTLPANQVGNGLTNAQVLDNITISSSGNVSADALTSGTVPTLRIGNQKYQTKSIIIPYPDSYLNIPFGNIYMPVASTITQIAGRIRETVSGGNCTAQVKINSTSALTSPLAADSDGEVTNTILNPSIGAGTWMSFLITSCTLADDANELSITVVYLVN